MATPWATKAGTKATTVGADQFLIRDSEDAVLSTKDKLINSDVVGTFTNTVKTFDTLTTAAKTISGAINELQAEITTESIWDRAAAVITPQNAGDDLDMKAGDIFMIDPANTSNTKSFNLTTTFTPGFNSAEVSFSGLKSGSEKSFFIYSGLLDNSFIYGKTLSIDSQSTSNVTLERRTNIKTANIIARDGYFALNSIDTPVSYATTYTRIKSPTAGSYSGSQDYWVAENGTEVKYLELDGSTQQISMYKKLIVTGNISGTNLTNTPILFSITTETSTYNITAIDDLIRCNGTFTVNLPAATGSGKVYEIKNIGTGTITADGDSTDTIDGQLTQALSTQYDSLTVIDAAANAWDII